MERVRTQREIMKLRDVCEVVSGATPKTAYPEYWDGEVPWVTPKELSSLDSMYINDTEKKITKEGFDSCSTRMLPVGAVLLSSRAPIGHLAINSVPVCTNQDFKSLVPKKGIIPEYLYFCIMYFVPRLKEMGRGATFAEISKDIVENFEIPVVDTEEQQRIAKRLRLAWETRNKAEKRLAEVDSYLRALFVEMFGDPMTNPKGWMKSEIGEIATVKTGNTPSRKRPEYYGDHIEWIKSDNLNTPFHYATPAEEYLSESGAAIGRVVESGSILVTCIAGSKGCIGNAALVERRVAFNQQINSITCKSGIVPEFIYSQLFVEKRLIQGASTNSMKGMVSKSNFEKIEVIVPRESLQIDFALKFRQINTLKLRIFECKSSLDSLMITVLGESFG